MLVGHLYSPVLFWLCPGAVLLDGNTTAQWADGARLVPDTESPLSTVCTTAALKEELLGGSFQVKG